MNYRLAKAEDKNLVVPLMLQAMDDLAQKFVNSKKTSDAVSLFEHFFEQKDNMYSFENTIVCEEGGVIIGSITAYDGAKLEELRQPFLDYIKKVYHFNSPLENETEAGEFYLDTVSVASNKQGLGIGAKLIQQMAQHARQLGHQKIGLLVDKNNPNAKRLYERLGFEVVDEKPLLGGWYEHLVLEL